MFIKQNSYSKHSFFMHLALNHAKKNIGNTSENPSVGCVVVKNNSIISAGNTSVNGRPHAEQNALKIYRNNFKNSDLYVTLEPCSHHGKTPPCVKSIIKKKIKRVFFSMKDPDPRSYDKSSLELKKNKLTVIKGIYQNKVREFYKSYLKSKKDDLPFVTAKMAISKDYYTNSKKEKWITNSFSRGRVHLFRSRHDCIVTSVDTIISDNPRLTCRIPGLEKTSPSRVILDKNLKIPINSKIAKSAYKYKTILFFSKTNKQKIKYLKRLKIKLIKTSLSENNNFDLKNVLKKIKSMGFSRIFLETGLNLTSNFLRNNLVDVFQLFISKKKLQKNGSNSFKNNMNIYLKKKNSTYEYVNLFGDKLISYTIK